MSEVVHRVVVKVESSEIIKDCLLSNSDSIIGKLLTSREMPVVIQAEDIESLDQIALNSFDNIEALIYSRNRSCGYISKLHDRLSFKSNVWLSNHDDKPDYLAVQKDSYGVSIQHLEVPQEFGMIDQIAKYKVRSSKIKIVDKYLFSRRKRVDSMIHYLTTCFSTFPKVEIITDEEQMNDDVIDYFYNSYEEYSSNFKLYGIVSDHNFFHDRFLWCDWYVLKLGRGFDLRKNVSYNSIDGRLLSKSSSTWYLVYIEWANYLNKCRMLHY